MDDEKFNMSLRRFLKKVGVSSQQKIEQAANQSQEASGKITAKMTLSVPDLGITHTIEEDIELD